MYFGHFRKELFGSDKFTKKELQSRFRFEEVELLNLVHFAIVRDFFLAREESTVHS